MNLWILASGVTNPASAGEQGPISIVLGGRTFDVDRRVRVSREDEESWEGPLKFWCEAVREAAARPTFAGHPDHAPWSPGPYEAAAIASDR